MRHMWTSRQAYVALAIGLALVVAYGVLHQGSTGSVVYLIGACYGTALSCLGASRMPRSRRRIWWAFAAAQGLYLLGDLVYTFYDEVLQSEPSPSPADVVYLAQYPVLAMAVLWLIRGRQGGRDRGAFLDAAILTTGVTVVGTVAFVLPAAQSEGAGVMSDAVAAAYPLGDLLVLALVLRMFVTGQVRNTTIYALVLGIGALLVADLGYVVAAQQDWAYPDSIDLAYLTSYLLLGFAALHPSAHDLEEPAAERRETVTPFRLVLLGMALAVGPVTGEIGDLAGVELAEGVALIGGCVAAVLVVLRLGDLVGNLQRSAAQLSALARRDSLTGVSNRRSWDHQLERAWANAKDNGTALHVAVLDLDAFKQYNETFGHLHGDLVLKDTADAWAAVIEQRGFLARYGGQEFTALLPVVTTEEAALLLDRMRRAVSHGQACSIGFAAWDGVESASSMVARADRALYQAKRGGGDRIVFDNGDEGVALTAGDDGLVLTGLRSVFQPIVELDRDEVVGYEALSRFEGQEPAEVFGRAARDGTLAWLEASAIGSALRSWDGAGLLSVNVSPDTLLTTQFEAVLPADLTGFIIEVTEADLVLYRTEVLLALDDLRERGAKVAIDDFGVGFSNLHRVALLRPDLVKLDRSLVAGIHLDETLQAAVAAVVLFADRTGAEVIAEGIEHPEERDCVIGLGVRYGQGFLLGRPAERTPPRARTGSR
ncbi:bifunctional diguanylate cyclase/phosphodiesterase [Nocardioides humilatus]|uniref:Bifunctional diguanylate cyclase/phosphodiesterase n=1 Tax=Nocardioides humilatus TaxID=2607660 RepID=A0A5B1LEZ5_9ACTN|nr:bifunctional diguanylate cyclase/phosphodiesterase [Nocardioides humilatus]KAA1419235.1 bifunctional diguanylate cyclase/phosphodiesterase [Nocardioides humilatus]